MHEVDVVVLSRFPEIFTGFQQSIDLDAPELTKYVLWDSQTKEIPNSFSLAGSSWWSKKSSESFQMARSANCVWRAAKADHDLLYVGDDVRFIETSTIKRLQALAYSDASIGILSPKVTGLCAVEFREERIGAIKIANFVAFVCVYLKRKMLEKVGFLDERYVGYGVEDFDFCLRARRAGFKIGVAEEVLVHHGIGGHCYGSTFIKTRGEEQMGRDNIANWVKFAEKWGIENDLQKIFQLIRKG